MRDIGSLFNRNHRQFSADGMLQQAKIPGEVHMKQLAASEVEKVLHIPQDENQEQKLEQIIKKFISGNLKPTDAENQLAELGINNCDRNDNAEERVLTFTFNNYQYRICCSKDSADDGFGGITVEFVIAEDMLNMIEEYGESIKSYFKETAFIGNIPIAYALDSSKLPDGVETIAQLKTYLEEEQLSQAEQDLIIFLDTFANNDTLSIEDYNNLSSILTNLNIEKTEVPGNYGILTGIQFTFKNIVYIFWTNINIEDDTTQTETGETQIPDVGTLDKNYILNEGIGKFYNLTSEQFDKFVQFGVLVKANDGKYEFNQAKACVILGLIAGDASIASLEDFLQYAHDKGQACSVYNQLSEERQNLIKEYVIECGSKYYINFEKLKADFGEDFESIFHLYTTDNEDKGINNGYFHLLPYILEYKEFINAAGSGKDKQEAAYVLQGLLTGENLSATRTLENLKALGFDVKAQWIEGKKNQQIELIVTKNGKSFSILCSENNINSLATNLNNVFSISYGDIAEPGTYSEGTTQPGTSSPETPQVIPESDGEQGNSTVTISASYIEDLFSAEEIAQYFEKVENGYQRKKNAWPNGVELESELKLYLLKQNNASAEEYIKLFVYLFEDDAGTTDEVKNILTSVGYGLYEEVKISANWKINDNFESENQVAQALINALNKYVQGFFGDSYNDDIKKLLKEIWNNAISNLTEENNVPYNAILGEVLFRMAQKIQNPESTNSDSGEEEINDEQAFLGKIEDYHREDVQELLESVKGGSVSALAELKEYGIDVYIAENTNGSFTVTITKDGTSLKFTFESSKKQDLLVAGLIDNYDSDVITNLNSICTGLAMGGQNALNALKTLKTDSLYKDVGVYVTEDDGKYIIVLKYNNEYGPFYIDKNADTTASLAAMGYITSQAPETPNSPENDEYSTETVQHSVANGEFATYIDQFIKNETFKSQIKKDLFDTLFKEYISLDLKYYLEDLFNDIFSSALESCRGYFSSHLKFSDKELVDKFKELFSDAINGAETNFEAKKSYANNAGEIPTDIWSLLEKESFKNSMKLLFKNRTGSESEFDAAYREAVGKSIEYFASAEIDKNISIKDIVSKFMQEFESKINELTGEDYEEDFVPATEEKDYPKNGSQGKYIREVLDNKQFKAQMRRLYRRLHNSIDGFNELYNNTVNATINSLSSANSQYVKLSEKIITDKFKELFKTGISG